MSYFRFATIFVALALFAGCSAKEKTMDFSEVTDAKFRPGQVWKYKARAGEDDSTLTICRIETAGKLGTVVHISVNGVKVKSPQNKDGQVNEISHLPLSRSALELSVTQMLSDGGKPSDYREGYQTWRKAVEGGNGGVWTVSVADAIAAMETALNK